MPRPSFGHAAFLAAARDLVAQAGPTAVTVSSLTERLGAPSGSFYYRFASRDVLLAELWLSTAQAFQEGFVAAIRAGDGLTAALHTPVWVRAHLNDARVFLLHHRDDFVYGGWPEALKLRVKQQARRLDACYLRFARSALGSGDAERIRLARFVLADVPKAAVGSHLRRGEPPPPIVDKMITVTYRAILAQYGRENDGVRSVPRLDTDRSKIARRRRGPAKEADR